MMDKEKIKVVYSEPADYIPEDLRRKYKLGEFAESDMLKKIKAVMLGHAVGDALGVSVEFCTREELDENPVTDMMGFGSYPVPEGCWSDDTSMALCALDSLKGGNLDYKEIMDNFVMWLSNDDYTPTGETFDVGRTCLNAIRIYCRKDAPLATACGLKDEYSNGNGSLMRIHPFVLYAYFNFLNGTEEGYWKWMGCIKVGAELTHAHERSIMGCHIYADCLSFLLKEPTKASLKAGIKFAEGDLDYLPEFEHYKRIFEPNFDKLSRDEIRSTGYVVDTLEAALWCVLTTNSYRECVLKAVNLGDDTDTVAAIAGGLAGILYGLDSIPEEWLEKLKKRDYIEDMCKKASEAWESINENSNKKSKRN